MFLGHYVRVILISPLQISVLWWNWLSIGIWLILRILIHPQWSRSSSWGSTCTRLAACLLLIAQVCLIPSRESSSRPKARSLRWAFRMFFRKSAVSLKMWVGASQISNLHQFLFCLRLGAGWDAVPDVGPAARLRERGAVWRGHRAERRPSYYCHWDLWSRHSGKSGFENRDARLFPFVSKWANSLPSHSLSFQIAIVLPYHPNNLRACLSFSWDVRVNMSPNESKNNSVWCYFILLLIQDLSHFC